MGVLNVLLLPGGDHSHDHMEQEDTAAFPASFSAALWFSECLAVVGSTPQVYVQSVCPVNIWFSFMEAS